MRKLLKSKAGFTMIELMVVVIIVGILAAAAVPIYRGNVKKAIATEATSTLGSIRSAERIYQAQYSKYTSATSAEINSMLNVDVLDPYYFDSGCYAVASTGVDNFTATCTVKATGNTAPGAQRAIDSLGSGNTITMTEEGVIGGDAGITN